MGKEDWFVYELPFMFNNWVEYRDYLVDNLVLDPQNQENFKKYFASLETRYSRSIESGHLYKAQINSVLCNDYDMTKLKNWEVSHATDDQLARLERHSAKLNGHAEASNN
jgi:hypothetical protein